jgi:nucleotide-binding universal stress UspA family protein
VTYATLMVHLELGESNAGLLQIVGDLADRLQGAVIGIATCQPLQLALSDGYVTGEVIRQDMEQIERDIAVAEADFRAALAPRAGRLEWRSSITFAPLDDYLAHEARSADLIITKVDKNTSIFDSSHHVNIGDLVMQAGRPVLVVPATANRLELGSVVIGWKETPEARRAARDALPILQQADRVTIVEIAAEAELAAARTHLDDVAAWLKRHGVVAECAAIAASGDNAGQFDAIAAEYGADLIVAGAYGHSRLRELVLGGVTRDLLLTADRCVLVSH